MNDILLDQPILDFELIETAVESAESSASEFEVKESVVSLKRAAPDTDATTAEPASGDDKKPNVKCLHGKLSHILTLSLQENNVHSARLVAEVHSVPTASKRPSVHPVAAPRYVLSAADANPITCVDLQSARPTKGTMQALPTGPSKRDSRGHASIHSKDRRQGSRAC